MKGFVSKAQRYSHPGVSPCWENINRSSHSLLLHCKTSSLHMALREITGSLLSLPRVSLHLLLLLVFAGQHGLLMFFLRQAEMDRLALRTRVPQLGEAALDQPLPQCSRGFPGEHRHLWGFGEFPSLPDANQLAD